MKGAETSEVKEALKKATQEALDRGAFGNPWFWVTRASGGRGEPFFGSDRYVVFSLFFLAIFVLLKLLLFRFRFFSYLVLAFSSWAGHPRLPCAGVVSVCVGWCWGWVEWSGRGGGCCMMSYLDWY